MPGAKKNTLQTEPQAGALGRRDWQDGTAARAGHDGPAWETERGTSKVLQLGGDWESEQALMHALKIIQEIWEATALEKSAHNTEQLLISLPRS